MGNQIVKKSILEKVKANGGEYIVIKRMEKEDSDEGTVYKAVYRDTIPCALKEIKVDKLERDQIVGPLISEVKLLSLLKHTNLVRIIDYGDGLPQRKKEVSEEAPKDEPICHNILTESIPYIAMDYVDGCTLDKAIENSDFCNPVFLENLSKWLQQIAKVISYLHERGILHMDIKPDNVLIECTTNNAVLIDLGDAIIADINRFSKYFRAESVDRQLMTKYAYFSIQNMPGRKSCP